MVSDPVSSIKECTMGPGMSEVLKSRKQNQNLQADMSHGPTNIGFRLVEGQHSYLSTSVFVSGDSGKMRKRSENSIRKEILSID
jgi:hypothetical protein